MTPPAQLACAAVTTTVDTVVRLGAVSELRRHGAPLFEAHYAELRAQRPAAPPLDIDWGLLETLEAQGSLLCVTVWRGAQLVGYAVAVIAAGLFGRERTVQVQAVFMAPAARSISSWSWLRSVVRAQAISRGLQLVWSVKAGTAAALLLERVCGSAAELGFFERLVDG